MYWITCQKQTNKQGMSDSKYCNVANDDKSAFYVLHISHKIFSILDESCILSASAKNKTSCALCFCR